MARLELGESNPSFATLCDLAQKLGIVLVLDIPPNGLRSAWFYPEPSDTDGALAHGTRISFATRPAA